MLARAFPQSFGAQDPAANVSTVKFLGLIGPGERKSVQPMAERVVPGGYDQLHHFVAAGVWDAAPLEA